MLVTAVDFEIRKSAQGIYFLLHWIIFHAGINITGAPASAKSVKPMALLKTNKNQH